MEFGKHTMPYPSHYYFTSKQKKTGGSSMSILHNLWHGKIIPQEKIVYTNRDFEHKKKEQQEEYNLIKDELSESGKLHFENYERLSTEIQSIFEEQIFIDAFRLASKLMIDVFNE
jgi:hypothetical protein